MRTFLLSVGWCATIGTLYLACLGLDVYWNLLDWRPKPDGLAALLCAMVVAGLIAAWILARASSRRTVSVISVLLCLALLGAGLYALTPETLTQGLLGRDHSSPVWYRSLRAVLLAMPFLFWLAVFLKRTAGQKV